MSRNACDYLSVKITTVYGPFTRRVFAANGESGSLTVIDTVTLSLVARYDLSASCNEPAVLATDPATERLFVGCRNWKMVVVSGKIGGILATVPIGKGCDAPAYDSELRLAFSSNGEGTLT